MTALWSAAASFAESREEKSARGDSCKDLFMNDENLGHADLDALQSIAAANYMHTGKIPSLLALSRLVERGYVGAGCFGQIIVTDKGLQLLNSPQNGNGLCG